MNQDLINNAIRIALPPEFHRMDPEEKKRIYAASAVIPEWCVYEPELTMIFSASWKRMNGILAMMACSADGAKGLEKRMRIALRERDYRFGEYVKGKIGEKKAFGFTFRCTGKEGDLLNRTVMVRDGGAFTILPPRSGRKRKTNRRRSWTGSGVRSPGTEKKRV